MNGIVLTVDLRKLSSGPGGTNGGGPTDFGTEPSGLTALEGATCPKRELARHGRHW
jgi:hypothetical protein